MKKVLVVIGTRPEAIKLCPVVLELFRSARLQPVVLATAQHRELLDQVLSLFDVSADHDLFVQRAGQNPSQVAARVLEGTQEILARVAPDIVVVQGDTTTTLAGALAAFYAGIPVAHVEAGLRSGRRDNPFPEEMNRRLTTSLSDIHLAPTLRARRALLAEGVEESRIFVTGNTVIDALHSTLARPPPPSSLLAELEADPRRMLLVTAHRRESWAEGLASVGDALAKLARAEPDLVIVFPIHPNPVVRQAIRPKVEGLENVRLVEPVAYDVFAHLMARSHLILTDSGGIQEEGPALRKPVLVMRETSERPEGVEAGVAALVGTDDDRIVEAVRALLHDESAYLAMAKEVCPYGDGAAAARTSMVLEHFLEGSPRPDDFEWQGSVAPRGRLV